MSKAKNKIQEFQRIPLKEAIEEILKLHSNSVYQLLETYQQYTILLKGSNEHFDEEKKLSELLKKVQNIVDRLIQLEVQIESFMEVAERHIELTQNLSKLKRQVKQEDDTIRELFKTIRDSKDEVAQQLVDAKDNLGNMDYDVRDLIRYASRICKNSHAPSTFDPNAEAQPIAYELAFPAEDTMRQGCLMEASLSPDHLKGVIEEIEKALEYKKENKESENSPKVKEEEVDKLIIERQPKRERETVVEESEQNLNQELTESELKLTQGLIPSDQILPTVKKVKLNGDRKDSI